MLFYLLPDAAGDSWSTSTWVFYELDDLMCISLDFHILVNPPYSQTDTFSGSMRLHD